MLACPVPDIYFSLSFSQAINVKKLDSLFSLLHERGLASGCVAVAVNGKTVYQKAAGFANIDSNSIIAANTGTKYRIGSVSKMFTAVMIMQRVKEGVLNQPGYSLRRRLHRVYACRSRFIHRSVIYRQTYRPVRH